MCHYINMAGLLTLKVEEMLETWKVRYKLCRQATKSEASYTKNECSDVLLKITSWRRIRYLNAAIGEPESQINAISSRSVSFSSSRSVTSCPIKLAHPTSSSFIMYCCPVLCHPSNGVGLQSLSTQWLLCGCPHSVLYALELSTGSITRWICGLSSSFSEIIPY